MSCKKVISTHFKGHYFHRFGSKSLISLRKNPHTLTQTHILTHTCSTFLQNTRIQPTNKHIYRHTVNTRFGHHYYYTHVETLNLSYAPDRPKRTHITQSSLYALTTAFTLTKAPFVSHTNTNLSPYSSIILHTHKLYLQQQQQ